MLLSKATYSNSNIHTLMAVADMHGAVQLIRSSSGFSILPKDTAGHCRPGESNQTPSDNKMLAQPLSHSRSYIYRFLPLFELGHFCLPP